MAKDVPIVVSNHTGFMEGLFFTWQGQRLALSTDQCHHYYRMLACSKSQHRQNPWLHLARSWPSNMPGLIWKHNQALLALNNAIKVDRTNTASCDTTKDHITQRAKEAALWPPLAIYPEGSSSWITKSYLRCTAHSQPCTPGTCSNGLFLLSFKLGAFTPGVKVQRQSMMARNDACLSRLQLLSFATQTQTFVRATSTAIFTGGEHSVNLLMYELQEGRMHEKITPSTVHGGGVLTRLLPEQCREG